MEKAELLAALHAERDRLREAAQRLMDELRQMLGVPT